MTKGKIDSKFLLRCVAFIIGLFFSGLGVAITKKGELGVSPVSSIANVMSIRFDVLTIGNWLIISNCVLILGQFLILRKNFKIYQLLQIPLSFLFGYFTDFGVWMIKNIPVNVYPARLFCSVFGTAVLAFGIVIQIKADVIMNSGEAFVKAISDTYSKNFGTVKIIFDISFVTTSIVLSLLLCGGRILGTREGTIIAAIINGLFIKLYLKIYSRFADRKSK